MPEQDHRTTYLIRLGVMTYICALSLVAAFTIAFHFLTDSIVHRQETTAQIVNISGRQRMLSQRIAELALERATHVHLQPDRDTSAALLESIRLMEKSNHDLLRGSPATGGSVLEFPEVATIYRQPPRRLNATLEDFLAHARVLVGKPEDALTVADPDLIALEAEARQPLLDGLNEAVDAITRSSQQSIRHLRRTMAVLTVSLLAILALEAWFLYRPLFTRLATANRELIVTGRTDTLTGCLNRRGFAEEADRAIAKARSNGTVLSVLMIDVDRFKSINDAFGHAAGDAVINSVAMAMQSRTRKINQLCRMGGEEFASILHGTPLAGAAIAAESLRAAVENQSINIGRDGNGPFLTVTVSIGVSSLHADDLTLFHTLNRADKALYRAKLGGRNRIEIETDTASGSEPNYPHRSRV